MVLVKKGGYFRLGKGLKFGKSPGKALNNIFKKSEASWSVSTLFAIHKM